MLTGFTVFLIVVKSKGIHSCGCTGLESFTLGGINPIVLALARNAGLIAMAEWYIWDQREAET